MKLILPSQCVVACEVGVLLAVIGFALAYGMQLAANGLLARIGQ